MISLVTYRQAHDKNAGGIRLTFMVNTFGKNQNANKNGSLNIEKVELKKIKKLKPMPVCIKSHITTYIFVSNHAGTAAYMFFCLFFCC